MTRATVVALVALVACTRSSTPDTAGGSSPPPDAGSIDDACTGKPVPAHWCDGGKRQPKCNESRWQIDCLRGVAEDASPFSVVSPCPEGACGPEPAWDEADCMWGFASHASCESYDRGACTWTRRCRPQPCGEGNPLCHSLVSSRVGAPCAAEDPQPCPEGWSCADVRVNVGDPGITSTCIQQPLCEVLVCAEGTSCMILESYPPVVTCQRL